MLTKKQLSALARSDEGKLLPEDSEVMDALIDGGFMGHDGLLTEKGEAATEALKEKLKVLKIGMPLTERKIFEPTLAYADKTWESSNMQGVRFVTDGHMIFIGVAPLDLKTKKIEPSRKTGIVGKLRGYINTMNPGRFVLVQPTTWRVPEYPDIKEHIIFESKDQKTVIDGKYYDMVLSRHPEAKWYLPEKKDTPLVAVSTRTTLNGVVAIIAKIEI